MISENTLMSEMWKSVVGYGDYYSISTHGRVLSCARVISTDGRGMRSLPDRLLKIRKCKGYSVVHLSKHRITRFHLVHRLVALAFVFNPDPENKTQVNHKDGNKSNNFASNLEWVTRLENESHAMVNNLKPRGSRFGRSQLTDADIPKIRRLYKRGMTQIKLARIYGLSQPSISSIILRTKWSHVP